MKPEPGASRPKEGVRHPMYVLLIVVLVPIALAINHLLTSYRYTRKGKALLLLVWAVSYLAGVAFVRFHFPDIEPVYIYLLGLALSLPIFAALGLAAVSYLRHRILGGYDREIVRLKREREHIRSGLALVEQRLALTASRQRAIEGRHRERLAEQNILQQLLDEWQQAGGVARLRVVKVQEWRQEMAGLSHQGRLARREGIQTEIDRLGRAGEGGSADRQDQLRAQLKVVDLGLLEPDLAAPNEELAEMEKAAADLHRQKGEYEARLNEVGREAEEWHSRRTEFLSKQITLG